MRPNVVIDDASSIGSGLLPQLIPSASPSPPPSLPGSEAAPVTGYKSSTSAGTVGSSGHDRLRAQRIGISSGSAWESTVRSQEEAEAPDSASPLQRSHIWRSGNVRAVSAGRISTWSSTDLNEDIGSAAAILGARTGGSDAEEETSISPRASPTHGSREDATDFDQQLANRGFSVHQLLEFWEEHCELYNLNAMLTREVVRDILIPQTSMRKTCYMNSPFMEARGGPMSAKRFVSHAWDSPFLALVLNIVLDASGMLAESGAFSGLWQDRSKRGVRRLIDMLDREVLSTTYWICIFAVNQHGSICGDCPKCRGAQNWKAEEFAANPCFKCGTPKRFPCSCRSLKHFAGDPFCETSRLYSVAAKMQTMVVSLDPKLEALTRMWVMTEVGEGRRGLPIHFRAALALTDDVLVKLLRGLPVVPPLDQCQATYAADKEALLRAVEVHHKGRGAFDDFVSCLVELHFGRCTRLGTITGDAESAIAAIPELTMDFRWCRESLRNLAMLDISGTYLGKLQRLSSLCVNLRGCIAIREVKALGDGLRNLPQLQEFVLDLSDCSQLEEVSALGLGLGQTNLHGLRIDFSGCTSLQEIKALGEGVGKLQSLETMYLIFSGCTALQEVASLGVALGKTTHLQSLILNFTDCSSLEEVSEVEEGLSRAMALNGLFLTFNGCSPLAEDQLARAREQWRRRRVGLYPASDQRDRGCSIL